MYSPTNDNEDDSAVQDASVAAVDPTKINKDGSAVQNADLLIPEMKSNDEVVDLLVDEMNTNVNDVLADKKEAHSREIDLMQEKNMKYLKVEQ
jgi:hypothetical protein